MNAMRAGPAVAAILLAAAGALGGAEAASSPPPAAGTPQPVVQDGQSWCPVFSPDGKSLAYLTLIADETKVCLGLVRPGAKGAAIAELVEPTGRKLTDSLWRSMYCFPMLRFAPDGNSVFVLLQRGRKIECVAVGLADGNVRRLGEIDKPEKYFPHQFEFGPDGRLVVSFVFRGEGAAGWQSELAPHPGQPLAIFDPAGGEVRRSEQPYRRFVRAPAGNAVLATTPREVWRLSERYERQARIIEFEDPEDVRRILFAGPRVLLVLRTNPNKTQGDYALVSGGKLQPIRSTPMAFDQMIALPDGRLLWGQPPARGGLSLQAAGWEGNAPRFAAIEFDAAGLAKLDAFYPSPDGTRVIALATPSPAAGRQPGPVLLGMGGDGMHPLSMDPKVTKRLLLLEIGKDKIQAAPLPLPGRGNLLRTEQDSVIWSPDGKAAAFVRTMENRLSHNADSTRLDLMPCEFLARGEIWKVEFPAGQ